MTLSVRAFVLTRAGRAFSADDREGAPGVCIINESLAKRLFPGESPLGQVMLRGRDAEVRAEVVGVIRDVKTNGLNLPAPDEVYYPFRQMARFGMAVVARTTGDAAALHNGLELVGIGLVIGLAGAAGAARLIQTLLFDV